MKINSFQIENYKCFDKTDVVPLTSGINLVLGKNNVGKTALLECFTPFTNNFRHRSLDVSADDPRNYESCITLSADVEGDLIVSDVYSENLHNMPFPIDWSDKQKIDHLHGLAGSQNVLKVLFSSMGGRCSVDEDGSGLLYWKGHRFLNSTSFRYDKVGATFSIHLNDSPSVLAVIAGKVREKVYRFRAQRLNDVRSGIEVSLELNPDANNLAGVLNYLYTSNQVKWKRLCSYIQSIFPNVYSISTVPVNQAAVEIRVWPVPPETERSDMCISLAECGTGIGQVLAILFLVITSERPRVIIIDEPNSFLHPGASKKLIEILKCYPQHQYIISTHSPEIIKIADPSTILYLSQDNGKTNIENIDKLDFEKQKSCLSDLGASLSDMFSSDNILWVEGPTEEVCFPLILEASQKKFGLGTSILSVRNTGDFGQRNSKKVEWVTEVYCKLSYSGVFIPRAIGFIFDREGLSSDEMEEKRVSMQGKVTFLSRRMYENYLLDPDAIATVLNTLPTFSKNNISPDIVDGWIKKNGSDHQYKAGQFAVYGQEWCRDVHAGNLLKDMFSSLSDEKEKYQKTEHSLAITRVLIKSKPDVFVEIVNLLSVFTGGFV